MQNEEGKIVDLYIPRKCSATNRLITAKDASSVQIDIAEVSFRDSSLPIIYLCAQNEWYLMMCVLGRRERKDHWKEEDSCFSWFHEIKRRGRCLPQQTSQRLGSPQLQKMISLMPHKGLISLRILLFFIN